MPLPEVAARRVLFSMLCVVAVQALAGCAAMIMKSERDAGDLIRAGATETELVRKLGAPLRTAPLTPPRAALKLWESDHQVALLRAQDTAVSESVFRVRGRLDKDARASQAGFDSFMSLGLAEVVLIPKALWQRSTLRLTVWFDAEGQALAYEWTTASGAPFVPGR